MAPLVLVVTSLEDVTADMVIAALNRRHVPVVRVDPADIGPDLKFGFRLGDGASTWRGRLRTASREVTLERVTSVYHRRPTPYSARFSYLPQQQRDFATAEARHGLSGVLDSLHGVRYVNHPAAITRADFKPAQLQVAVESGLTIPPTLITNDVEAACAFAAEQRPLIYKTFRGLPPSEDGYSGAIWTQRVDPDAFDESLAVTAHLFQAEVPKVADVRVTAVGHRLFAQQITTPDGALDWRRGDWDDHTYTPLAVPEPIASALRAYLAAFRLVFGCFDFALTGPADNPNSWIWLECNPNGQWGWLPDADLVAEAFADVLCEEGDVAP